MVMIVVWCTLVGPIIGGSSSRPPEKGSASYVQWYSIVVACAGLHRTVRAQGALGFRCALRLHRFRGAPHEPDAALLQVDGVSKSFGALAALTDVSLTVHAGEVVSVIGPNGAGKSTLFNVITGLHGATRGRVLFNGHVITGRAPEAVNRLGLAKTFQITNVFPGISVYENVRVGRAVAGAGGGRLASLWRGPMSRKPSWSCWPRSAWRAGGRDGAESLARRAALSRDLPGPGHEP